jgi:hypothetical protein
MKMINFVKLIHTYKIGSSWQNILKNIVIQFRVPLEAKEFLDSWRLSPSRE